MQRNARVATDNSPSRLRIALAAAWLIASLVIGGVVGAEPSADPIVAPEPISRTVPQP